MSPPFSHISFAISLIAAKLFNCDCDLTAVKFSWMRSSAFTTKAYYYRALLQSPSVNYLIAPDASEFLFVTRGGEVEIERSRSAGKNDNVGVNIDGCSGEAVE